MHNTHSNVPIGAQQLQRSSAHLLHPTCRIKTPINISVNVYTPKHLLDNSVAHQAKQIHHPLEELHQTIDTNWLTFIVLQLQIHRIYCLFNARN